MSDIGILALVFALTAMGFMFWVQTLQERVRDLELAAHPETGKEGEK